MIHHLIILKYLILHELENQKSDLQKGNFQKIYKNISIS